MLEEFLGREKVAPLMAKGWVDLMIDTDRDTNGEEIMKRFKGDRSGGLPWLVILDSKGEERISSNAPPKGGNIGSPVSEAECAHFLVMLEQTRGAVTDEELATLKRELEAHAKKYRR